MILAAGSLVVGLWGDRGSSVGSSATWRDLRFRLLKRRLGGWVCSLQDYHQPSPPGVLVCLVTAVIMPRSVCSNVLFFVSVIFSRVERVAGFVHAARLISTPISTFNLATSSAHAHDQAQRGDLVSVSEVSE